MAECVDWRKWLARHGPAALLYARQLTANVQDAEDAVHEGFVRFWNRRSKAREAAGLFFACVRSAALDQRRRNRRRARRELAREMERPFFVMPLEGQARREEVERALAALPEAQREAVVLKIWGGLTLAEVAASLGESPNTIASRYQSALQKLAGLLAPEVEHER